jgi:DNA-binding transcriptional MerR regulator
MNNNNLNPHYTIRQEDDTVQFPIRELSARTNVNTVTIRAWERRYGLLKPQRTAKGHRLYREEDVKRVEMILALINRGVPLSKIKSLLAEGQQLSEIETSALDDNWSSKVAALTQYAQAFSATRIESLLGELLIQYPPAVCLEKLLKPSLEALQNNSDHNAAASFAESEIMRYALLRLSAKNSGKGKQAVYLACGDKAPLWCLAIAALELADRKFQVRLISQQMTERAWVAMSRAIAPAISIYYQDGVWKEEIGNELSDALSQHNNMIVCGTAPVVFGFAHTKQVFADIEKYLADQSE